MEISLNTVGRNTISYIKPENIITIHGKNGVGKSMASTLLEISSGNYTFENEDRFNKLSKIIQECEITFKISESNQYLVKLQPFLWKFDKHLNRINPLTLGTYFFNEKEIDFSNFTKHIFIRTIRGDESLQQQILFFKDVFIGKIQRKIDQIEKKIEFLQNYEKWFSDIIKQENIKKYSEEQGKLSSSLDELSNLSSTIRNRKTTLRRSEEQLEIVEKLQFLEENDKTTLSELIGINTEKLKSFRESMSNNSKKIALIESKLEKLTQDYDEDTKKYIKSLQKLKRKKEELENRLESQYKINIKEISKKKKDLEKKIVKFESEITSYKRSIEDLNKKNERIILINSLLIKLRDTLGQSISQDFFQEKLLRGLKKKKDLQLSFKELYEIIMETNVEFSESETLQDYKDNVEMINGLIRQNTPIIENLIKFNSVCHEIRDLKSKNIGTSSKLDKYLDLEKQIENLNTEHSKLLKQNQDIENDAHNLKIKKTNQEEILKQINSIPPQSKLLMELKTLGKDLADLTPKKLLHNKTKIKQEIQKNSRKLHHDEELEEKIQRRIEITKKEISRANESIQKSVEKLGLKDIKEILDYSTQHSAKFQTYLKNTKNIYTRLNSLKDDIKRIINGRKPKNPKNLAMITTHFDSLFKKIYGTKEFFEFVFKDYSKIERFDIAQKTIVFETHAGLTEKRDLEEFSSGEKTYAYCRAIISMSAHMAKYNIVILDESYALLDHEHSHNLYEFQIQMVKSNGISKFINILPLKENLDSFYSNLQSSLAREQKYGNQAMVDSLQTQFDIVKEFKEEANKNGYYQEILYPVQKTLGNVPIHYDNNSERQSDNVDLPYSFVLDGSNISRNNQNSKFARIRDVIDLKKALLAYGVPEENIIILFGAGIRHHLAKIEESTFRTLLKEKNVNQAPKGKDDDSFFIQYAMRHNSYIISNDHFEKYKKKSPEKRGFLETHSIRYTIMRNDVIFEGDFDKRIKKIMAGK